MDKLLFPFYEYLHDTGVTDTIIFTYVFCIATADVRNPVFEVPFWTQFYQ